MQTENREKTQTQTHQRVETTGTESVSGTDGNTIFDRAINAVSLWLGIDIAEHNAFIDEGDGNNRPFLIYKQNGLVAPAPTREDGIRYYKTGELKAWAEQRGWKLVRG